MKLFYGEKLVAQNEYLSSNKNLIYHGKKLLLISDKRYTEIDLDDQRKFVFWGKILAIIHKNGKAIPVDIKGDGKEKLKKVFKEKKIENIVKKLEGAFVGCIINKNDEVTIFADNFNRKDVFYNINENGVIASTDLSVVVPKKKKSYDQASLVNLLMIYGSYAPKKHTIYRDVRRLGVGEYLILKNNKANIKQILFKPTKTQDFNKKELEEYYKLLIDSIKIRGSKNINWVYLSSGWDSTAILAILVKLFGSSHVKAVTGKTMYSSRSKNGNIFEINRAKKFAEYYNVDTQVVPADYTKKDSMKHLEKIRPYLRDNHIYAGNSGLCFHISEYIRKNASPDDAFFCGEISDGVHNLGFSQFTTILEHPVLEFREYSDKMASYLFGPTFYKSILQGTYSKDAIYKLLRSRRIGRFFDDEKDLSEYEKKKRFIESFLVRKDRIPFYSLKNEKFLTDYGRKKYDSEMFETYFKKCVDTLKPETVYSWLLHLYNSFHWQGSSIKTFTSTAEFNKYFLSMPFWDTRLQQYFERMPENYGRGLEMRRTKYPLKWALENKIDYPKHLQVGPHSYIYDKRPTFSFDTEVLYYSTLRPFFLKIMSSYPFEQILDKKYFNLAYYRKLTDNLLNGVEVTGEDLGNLHRLVFLCWIGWY